jgi:cation:H+ antiporter
MDYMSVVFLVVGLGLLAVAGDALVRGALSAAQLMHIPAIITGLTIVAFGTSAPELIVSLEAALKGSSGLALGNVIGSNIANTLLVLGVPAMMAAFAFAGGGIRRSVTFLFTISIVFFLLMLDGEVSRFEGLILFTLLIIYLTYIGIDASKERKKKLNDISNGVSSQVDDEEPPLSVPMLLVFLAFGIVGLGIGGKLTIMGAIGISQMFGIAETAVGLTIVALGTSLPELAASISAALRKQAGMMIGNIVGSSIFNTLGIVGITAMVIPLGVPKTILSFDIWIMLGVFSMLIPMAYITRHIGRLQGLVMFSAYLAYILMAFR